MQRLVYSSTKEVYCVVLLIYAFIFIEPEDHYVMSGVANEKKLEKIWIQLRKELEV